MAVNLNAAQIWRDTALTATDALLDGSLAPTTIIHDTRPRFTVADNAPFGRYGMRVTFPAAVNLTAREFITLGQHCESYSQPSGLADVADGGIRLIFVDSAGNWAGYNLYGGNIPGYYPDNNQGFLTSWAGVRTLFHISRLRTPDISSGTINWGAIAALEVSINRQVIWGKDFGVYSLDIRGVPTVTGVERFLSIQEGVRTAGQLTDPQLLASSPVMHRAAAQQMYSTILGLNIGDGSTHTTLIDSGFGLGFENPYEFSPAYVSCGPWIQLGDGRTRPLNIVQSATDVLTLTDGSVASAGWWQWALSGLGTATCTRVQFLRFDGFVAGHGHYVDCEWVDGDAPVTVSATTVITQGVIRGAKHSALSILGAAGSYDALGVLMNNPAATYDVEVGAGGAGTYSLLGVSVPSGYTLRIRNVSPVNAVVVSLPIGVAYAASTVGGDISIEVPDVSAMITAPYLVAGSRVHLLNLTDGVVLLNTVLASDGLTLSTPYLGDKIVRLRADKDTKLSLETAGVFTATGLTFLDVQSEDTVYQNNAVDGSTCTEFSADGSNVQIDINDPDGLTHVQRLYAWSQWYMTTEEGVASPFFGAVTAVDDTNYVIDQTKADIKLDNISTIPVQVVGGYLYRKNKTTVIAAGSYSIQMDPGKSYGVETGISGLTNDESAKLDRVSLLALESTAQAVKTGTDALVARPVPVVPTAAEVTGAVWADPKADTLALESSVAAVGTNIDNILAKPDITVPTAAQIRDSVWADAVVTTLAKEDTLIALEDKVDGLVAKPEPTIPTAAAISTTVWAATEAAALAKEATLLATDAKLTALAAKPDLSVPTAVEIKTAVWADAKADLLAKEATLAAVGSDVDTILAKPDPVAVVVPTAAEIKVAVWADPTVATLAKQVTVLTLGVDLAETEAKVDVLVARPVGGATAAEIRTELAPELAKIATKEEISNTVWAHAFAKTLLTVGKFLGLK